MKRKLRLVVEYPQTAYEEGIDAIIDSLVDFRRLKETGSGMDLNRGVRDRSFEGNVDSITDHLHIFLDLKGLSRIQLFL